MPTDAFRQYAYTGPTNLVSGIFRLPDGKLLVMGNFEYYRGPSPYVVRLNSDATRDESFQAEIAKGAERPIGVLSDGKIIIGGIASHQGVSGMRLFRLNQDGSHDNAYNPGGVVQAPGIQEVFGSSIAQDGKLYLLARLQTAELKLIRLNSNGAHDNSFVSAVNMNCTMVFMAAPLQDGKVLTNGCDLQGLTRLNSDGSVDQTFQRSGSITGYSLTAATIRDDGKIWVGGQFSNVTNGVRRTNLVLLNADGTLDENYIPSTDFTISRIKLIKKLNHGRFLLEGKFNVNGVDRNLVIIDALGRVLKDFFFPTAIPQTLSSITDVEELNSGKLVIGVNYPDRNKPPETTMLQLMNEDGTVDTSFGKNEGFNYRFNATYQHDGKILVMGKFSHFGEQPAKGNIARLHADGNRDESFNQGNQGFSTYGNQRLIRLPDGKFFCLDANYYNGEWVSSLFRMYADGTHDKTFRYGFRSVASGAVVNAVAPVEGGYLFALAANNNGGSKIVRLLIDGSKDKTFPEVETFPVKDMNLLHDGGLILVGERPAMSPTEKSGYVIRLKNDFTVDTDFQAQESFDLRVTRSIVLDNGKILVSGYFTKYNNIASRFVARLNSNGSLDETFQGPFGAYELGNVQISGMEVLSNGKIILTGLFRAPSGDYTNILLLNEDGSRDEAQQPIAFEGNLLSIGYQFTSMVFGMDKLNNKLLVTGDFIRFKGGNDQSLLADFNIECDSFDIKVPTRVEMCTGGELRLVATEQRSDLGYQWMKDGQLVGTGRDFVITHVQPDDSGLYSVKVNGGCNNSKLRDIEVNILKELKIIKPLSNLTVCEGDTARFVVEAVGGNLSYQWYRQGKAIPGANSSVLTLVNTKLNNSGVYRVVVTGSCGAPKRLMAVLNVHPRRNKQIFDLKMPDGKLRLSIDESQQYQWYMNSSAMEAGQYQSVLVDKPGSYFVRTLDKRGCRAESDSFLVNTGFFSEVLWDVFPNPFQGTINIKLTCEYQGRVEVMMMDITGKVIRKLNMEKPDTTLSFQLDDLDSLDPGSFIIKLVAGHQHYEKLIIRN